MNVGARLAGLAARVRGRVQHERRVRFFRDQLRPGALVFDVGAATGAKTTMFLRAGARVVAIEPRPDALAALRTRFGDRVVTVGEAVADAPGDATLWTSAAHPETSHLAPGAPAAVHGPWSPLPVRTVTLDQLIARFGTPDFVKVDVEGAEDRVIAGLSAPVTQLMFEAIVGDPAPALRAARHLCALAPYRFRITHDEGDGFVDAGWSELSALHEALARTDRWAVDVHARRA